MDTTLLILFLLFTKHFVIDFPLQKPYQWMNKGTYGHPGGLLHSGLHGLGTWLSLVWFTPYAIALALFDFVVHYHVDWAKMNLNAKMGWGANTHEEFWWLLGLDQYIHSLTYIAIVAFIV
jgi:Protein of unknown function (DUF3307)